MCESSTYHMYTNAPPTFCWLDGLHVTIHALSITTFVLFEQFPCFCVFGCISNTFINLCPIRLIDWLFTVLRPAQEFFTYMETSPMPVKGCKIWAYAPRSGPLSREGSLSYHTYCETVPRFIRSPPKDHPHSVVSHDTHEDAEDLF
jgi:hypothetical protein